MKHLKKGRKFGRTGDKRHAMLKNLLGQFLEKRKISTTEAKAKELRIIAEKFITKAKIAAQTADGKKVAVLRDIMSVLPKSITTKKIQEIGKLFSGVAGGYTRVVKIGQRKSDGARMATIEFVIREEKKL